MFNVTGEGDVTVAQIPDMPAMGTISIAKTVQVLDDDGSPTGEETRTGGKTGEEFTGVEVVDGVTVPVYKTVPLANAKFNIVAADNIITGDGTVRAEIGDVVDTITTDENGYAISKPLYLGSYDVVEIEVPTGTVLNPAPHRAILEYADQNTPLVNVDLQIENILQKIDLTFTKTAEQKDGSYKEMAGFKFGLYVSEDVMNGDDVLLEAGALIATATSGDYGLVHFTDIPVVPCKVKEMEALPGYSLLTTEWEVKLLPAEATDSYIIGVVNNGKAIQNHLKKSPDLTVDKTVDKAIAAPGDKVTWTITVFNKGTAAAADVVVNDVRLKGSDPFDADGNYAIGTLEAGESKTITVTETVAGKVGDVVKNVVIVNGNDPDGDPLPPAEDDAEYTVDPVTLTVTKTVDKKEAATGDTVTWTITIKNGSKADVKDVVAHDVRLAGISPFDGKGDYAIGFIKSGETKTITVSEKVVATSGTVKNIVVVNGKDPSGKDLPPKDAEAEFVVKDEGLVITKTVDNATPKVGDTVTWTITISNTAKYDMYDVYVTDARLKGIKPFDANGNYEIGLLKAGETKTITASEKVTAESGTVKNVAIAGGKTPDGKDLPPKEAEAEYTVTPNDGMVVTKTVDNKTPKVGDTVTWTITVENKTGGDLKDVVITDARLKGISPFDADGKFTIATLAKDAVKTITATEKVTGNAGETVKNIVVVDAKKVDGTPLPQRTAEAEYKIASPTDPGKTGGGAQTGQDGLPIWLLAVGVLAAAGSVTMLRPMQMIVYATTMTGCPL